MEILKSALRPAIHLAREASVRRELLMQKGPDPLAVFLPAHGPHGAALLRIYNIADALGPLGWRRLVMPWKLTLDQRHRILARARPDVLVMQGARHALNRPAFYPGCPIVYDLDDADFHLPHLATPVRRAMPEVSAVIAGSQYIATWCQRAGARATHRVLTGMPVSDRPRPPQAVRPPVVAWAQTRPMTYTREAALVLQVMEALSRRCPGVRLRLYDRRPGDDPAFPARFEAAGIRTEWYPAMPLQEYLAAFDDVALGLAPLCPDTPFSRGKSVGKVLAYLDRHVPVLASAAGEHPRVFDAASGVVSNDPGVWVDRAARLLHDAGAREAMARAGFRTFRGRLSTGAATAQVAAILTGELAKGRRRA